VVAAAHDLDSLSVRRYLSDLDTHGFVDIRENDRVRPGPKVTKRIRIGPRTREALGVDIPKKFLELSTCARSPARIARANSWS
jgi:hypothetical protein